MKEAKSDAWRDLMDAVRTVIDMLPFEDIRDKTALIILPAEMQKLLCVNVLLGNLQRVINETVDARLQGIMSALSGALSER